MLAISCKAMPLSRRDDCGKKLNVVCSSNFNLKKYRLSWGIPNVKRGQKPKLELISVKPGLRKREKG